MRTKFCVSLLAALASTAGVVAQTPDQIINQARPASAEVAPPASRNEAKEIIRELRHIVTPLGIERNEIVQIGGIGQYVSIRGADRRNPVLLIIHGGPGFPTMPLAWWGAHGLEEFFTVVQWDQRGAGKTYMINDPKTLEPTIQPARFVDDAEELTGWLRRQLGKDKMFVLGTSWGSYVGTELARRRPEWLHAYIGMGQLANSPESERRGYAFALAAARKADNKQAIADLESIAPYAASGKPIPLKDIQLERKWSDYFGGVMAYRHFQADGLAAQLSPDYSDDEAKHIYDGNGYSEQFLLSPVLGMDYTKLTKLGCPLIIFAGRHDRTVNSYVAKEWFDRVHAPRKEFVWFENSGHEIMMEAPGKFLVTLVDKVRPLAASDRPLSTSCCRSRASELSDTTTDGDWVVFRPSASGKRSGNSGRSEGCGHPTAKRPNYRPSKVSTDLPKAVIRQNAACMGLSHRGGGSSLPNANALFGGQI